MFMKSCTSVMTSDGNIKSHSYNPRVEMVRVYPEADHRIQEAQRRLRAERLIAAKSHANRAFLQRYGFEGPMAYVILGNAYAVRRELRAHGAKYTVELGWICPVEPTWLTPIQYVPVKASALFECDDAGNVRLRNTAPDEVRHLDPLVGSYVGNVGGKVTLKVHVTKVSEYRTAYRNGHRMVPFATYKYIMKTDEGNTVVWHTPCEMLKDGGTFVLAGLVEEHFDHYNVRCTELTHCKILKEGMHHDIA